MRLGQSEIDPLLPDLPEGAPPSSVLILNIWPNVDCGRYPIKRELGDEVQVWADVFRDGHDAIGAHLDWWPAETIDIREAPFAFEDNDRWTGRFRPDAIGRWEYQIMAYPDPITSKRIEIIKKFDAAVDISLELKEFDLLLGQVVDIYPAARSVVADLRDRVGQRKTNAEKVAIITGLDAIADLRPFRNLGGEQRSDVYSLTVDRVRARFAAWYSMFPRSSGTVEGKSATFKDVEARLPAIAELGFDVLYFTPIHPIGSTNKKGKNNSLRSTPEDPGSPYAIGSAFGGHDAVEPTLGTIDDFDHLVAEAATHNMEIALDVALQGSPDHPWAKEHPDFFTVRPDGSIKFAENPPKKYEDIYPLSFDTAAWQKLWFELERVITFWIDHGVRSFRVDNPHTKPTIFWEWLITRIHRTHPEVI
ncbi:MAG TPA: DUF3416 domain-containing protein, partial [Thermomicrobiales bacterium]|nr:DUF3416 domain-containing protein [Thermomicrobiales bacterium]